MRKKIALALIAISTRAVSGDVYSMDGSYLCNEDHLIGIVKNQSQIYKPRHFILKISGGVAQIKESEKLAVPYTFYNLLDDISVNREWYYARQGLFNEFMLSGSHFKWIYSRRDNIKTGDSIMAVSQGTCSSID